MVILRTRNKITDFLMILAWASPFNIQSLNLIKLPFLFQIMGRKKVTGYQKYDGRKLDAAVEAVKSGAGSKKHFESLIPRVEPQNSSRVPFWVPRNKLDQNTGLQSRNWSPFFETTEKVSRSWDSKINMAAIRLIQNNRRRHRRQNNNNFIHM